MVVSDRAPYRVQPGEDDDVVQVAVSGCVLGATTGDRSQLQQCIKSGLLDEIHLDLVPVLLGDGVRLFDQSAEPIELQITRVIGGAGVTHLTFRVVK